MKIALLFGDAPAEGTIAIAHGRLDGLHTADGTTAGDRFALPRGGRLEVTVAEESVKRGARATICRVQAGAASFAVLLRDLSAACPVWIPEFQAAAVPADDPRSYAEVAAAVAGRALVSDFARFAHEPELDYATAAQTTRRQVCPTWLGIGRDLRMFRVSYQDRYEYWGQIQPVYHTKPQSLRPVPDDAARIGDAPYPYHILFEIGQGASCRPRLSRRLEDGVLPILRAVQAEQDVRYEITAFATLERGPLAPGAVRGSDWRACCPNTGGCMLSLQEKEVLRGLLEPEMRGREQEVVLCLRIEAVNTGAVPRYAWFKAAHVRGGQPNLPFVKLPDRHGFQDGRSRFEDAGTVYALNRLDGQPLPEEEMAVLLPPGGTATFDILIPHSPLPPDRAAALMTLDVAAHLDGCRAFWRARLGAAAAIEVPERPVNEAVQAGLLHCDLVALGREPDGPVLPTIGWYSPIGTESAPIIQFFDSMGWHDLAARCIQFFLERQRPDGFIQNFARYESETGPLLWTLGEHYRYTRDDAWLRRVLPNVRRAADYLLAWRQRNQKEEYREQGYYGLIDGKVADPDDFYHSFFLNAGTYLGLKRVAELAAREDPDYARRLAAEVAAYREDIRAAFRYAQARAPVVPLGDGSWAPLMPPWVEYTGGISLYADGGNWFSHGAFASRSCLTGPLWLILSEVFDADEPEAAFMLKTNQYPVTLDNAALSQPYYCRHDIAHLRRGEVNAFLRVYYNQLTALHDRETYTFWEHYFHASQHKTHEEAWFLMQTRWMLWREEGETLCLLSGVPRAWLADGREIRLRGVKSYFGPLALHVRSALARDCIEAELELPDPPPRAVRLRLPHPDGRRARACEGGVYDAAAETVTLAPTAGGPACVTLRF